jgi:hypothetical protein
MIRLSEIIMFDSMDMPIDFRGEVVASPRKKLHPHKPSCGQYIGPSSFGSNREHGMTSVVLRPISEGAIPLHVLIVVVGKYDVEEFTENLLNGAGVITGDIVDFWRLNKVELQDGQELASINVLSSDPYEKVAVAGDTSNIAVDLPTRKNCADELNKWVNTVEKTGGIGILHWVGHGYSRTWNGQEGLNLLCTGLSDSSSEATPKQAGLDWKATLDTLNTKANGRPIFCFIDACRKVGRHVKYYGIGDSDEEPEPTSQVFYSCRNNEKAYWVDLEKFDDGMPDFEGQAIGTRAFMAALSGFGACVEDTGASSHHIKSAEVSQAASALSSMWMSHAGLGTPIKTVVHGGEEQACIARTATPKSVAEIRTRQASVGCEALRVSTGQRFSSHSKKNPFRFALDREVHQFRPLAANWSESYTFIQPVRCIVL